MPRFGDHRYQKAGSGANSCVQTPSPAGATHGIVRHSCSANAGYSRAGCDSLLWQPNCDSSRCSMALKKQEFYEGAALHLIARSGNVKSIRYEQPFFVLNERVSVLLKYSTRELAPALQAARVRRAFGERTMKAHECSFDECDVN